MECTLTGRIDYERIDDSRQWSIDNNRQRQNQNSGSVVNASPVEMQVEGKWKDSWMPSHYASAEIAKNNAMARIKYGKGR